MRTTHYVAAGAIFIAGMAAAFVFLGSGRSKKELSETAAETTKPSEASTNNAEWHQFEYGPSRTNKYKNEQNVESKTREVHAVRLRRGDQTTYMVAIQQLGTAWHLRDDEARSLLRFVDSMSTKQPAMKEPVQSAEIEWSCLARNRWAKPFTDQVEFSVQYGYKGRFSSPLSGGFITAEEFPPLIECIRLVMGDIEAIKQVGSPPTP